MSIRRRHIESGSVWEARVGYARAVRIGDFVFVSGTTSDGPDAYLQAKGAIARIEQALEEAGASLDDVVRTRMYVVNIDDWELIAKAHHEAFADVRPAATMVEVVLAAAASALVDPFVGTSGTQIGGPIDTFPGADMPFGMLQWSPDTPSQNAGGGYEYTDKAITGFSLTHLSGPGCNVFGDFAMLPVVGPKQLDLATQQPFAHAGEVAAPGYYAVNVGSPTIRTELSATDRTGLGVFTFPANTASYVMINAASNQAGVTDASARIVGTNEIAGSASSGFFCGMPDRQRLGRRTWPARRRLGTLRHDAQRDRARPSRDLVRRCAGRRQQSRGRSEELGH